MASRSRIQDSNTLEYFDFCALVVNLLLTLKISSRRIGKHFA